MVVSMVCGHVFFRFSFGCIWQMFKEYASFILYTQRWVKWMFLVSDTCYSQPEVKERSDFCYQNKVHHLHRLGDVHLLNKTTKNI